MFENLSWRLLPPCCQLCGQRSGALRDLCPGCEHDLVQLGNACRRCALPLASSAQICGACLDRPPAQDISLAAYRYEFPLDRLVQRFKFHADHAAGKLLSDLLARALSPTELPACILPVPLHERRLHARGFNQSELLFRPLADRLGIPLLTDRLKRQRETAVQSGMTAVARRRNVRDAFVVVEDIPRHVAVVDDVMTTGSTFGEIARLLKRSGAKRVQVWSLARTP